jgi:hypothetical protein
LIRLGLFANLARGARLRGALIMTRLWPELQGALMIKTCVCVCCGQEFEAKRAGMLLCSDECRRRRESARAKVYYAANRERICASVKAYYEANRERVIAKHKAWSAEGRERMRANVRAWREAKRSAALVGDGDDR